MAKRPSYPPEFRRRILDLVRSGRSINSLSAEFQVARQSIMNWLKQDDIDAGRRDDGLTTEERKELTLLRRENKRLKLEAERDPVKSRGLVRSGDGRCSEQIFGFVKAYQANYTVAMLCRALEVSPS